MFCCRFFFFFFFFNDTATTEIYTLSLHDALPLFRPADSRWPPTSSSPREGRLDPSVALLPARSLCRGRYPHQRRSAPTQAHLCKRDDPLGRNYTGSHETPRPQGSRDDHAVRRDHRE